MFAVRRLLVLPPPRSASPCRHCTTSSTINMPLKCGQGLFDSLLVVDFEATCDNRRAIRPQEVIEFPVLRVDTRSWKVVSKFHRYVRPEVHPVLTPFCTQLTGIIQEMVDDESDLKTVLDDFHSWLKDEEKLKDNNHQFAVVTCGDWDLKQLLPNQLNYLSIPIPFYFQSWINLKIIFAEVTGIFPKNLPHMLSHLKLPTIGRLHSGIDDCWNIAAVIEALNKSSKSPPRWRYTTQESSSFSGG